jgi:SH3-like domain-containing protein
MKPILILILLLVFTAAAHAAETDMGGEGKGTSGLPLPRFASLRTGEANLRTGPGTRYPIDWVLVSKGMPLEITAEYDVWRRVRDWEGSEGWVHKSALSGKRGLVITGTLRELREKDKDQAPVMAHLEPGAIGQLLSCAREWCRARFGGIKGYIPKPTFWGAYEQETFN